MSLKVQWYYLIRNPVDNSFDNFTIIANEVATVDTDKYSVWTTPPGIYTLQVLISILYDIVDPDQEIKLTSCMTLCHVYESNSKLANS